MKSSSHFSVLLPVSTVSDPAGPPPPGNSFSQGPPPPKLTRLPSYLSDSLWPPPSPALLGGLVHPNTGYTLMTKPPVPSPARASSELQIRGPAAPQRRLAEGSQAFHIQCGHSEPDCSPKLVPRFPLSPTSGLPRSSSVLLRVQTTSWKSPSTPLFSSLPHPTLQSPLPLMFIENSPTSHPCMATPTCLPKEATRGRR